MEPNKFDKEVFSVTLADVAVKYDIKPSVLLFVDSFVGENLRGNGFTMKEAPNILRASAELIEKMQKHISKGVKKMEQQKINLAEGLKDPEKAKEITKKIQSAIDELYLANQESLKELKKAVAVNEDATKQIKLLTQANLDLTQFIKDMHIILNSKKQLWENDLIMVDIMKGFAEFVTSSGAIKAGVLQELGKDENRT